MAKSKIFIVGDTTNNDLLFDPVVNGERKGRGFDEQGQKERAENDGVIPKAKIVSFKNEILGPNGEPQNYDNAKIVFYNANTGQPDEVDIVPESEWDARFEEQEKYKSSLAHLRRRALQGKPFPSLDQNGQGYCWMYSGGNALTSARAKQNQPWVRFSCHAGAWVIKNGKDEGGWTGLAGPYIADKGLPTIKEWPEKSMNGGTYNTAATWEVAKKFRPTETWIDMRASQYDRTLSRLVLATLLFNNIPCTGDYDWWSHSVHLMQWYRIAKGNWGPKGLNSWTDGWGDLGEFTLEGSKAVHSGAIALRTPMANV